jgi:hypothetical protein
MSEDAKSERESSQSLFRKAIAQPIVKLIAATLLKLKNTWNGENTLTGIQFYGDFED